MPHFDLETPTDVSQTDEQARAALSVFRSLQPTLTMYARTLSGNSKVNVVPAAQDNGSTDGTSIFYRPPLALGNRTPHVNSVCDKRDGYGLQRCPACAIREKVLVTIYHEIGHIWFDSFQKATEKDKAAAIKWVLNEKAVGSLWAWNAAERIKAAPPSVTSNFMSLVSLINQYLPLLVNAMEDARINSKLFETKVGLRRMFQASTAAIFREGFEDIDSRGIVSTISWKDRPLNTQAIIGTLCIGCGYNYDDWLHPKVVQDLHDDELNKIIAKMDNETTAAEVYHLSFEVLQRLRELGYCGTPQDPIDETPEEEPDEQTDADGTPDEDKPEDDCESDEGDTSEPDGQSSSDGTDVCDQDDETPEEDAAEAGADEGDSGSPRRGDVSDDGHSDSEKEVPESEGAPSDSDGPVTDEGDSSDASNGSSIQYEQTGRDSEEGEASPNGGTDATRSDSDQNDSDYGSEEELIDTGADDGYGGTSVERGQDWDDEDLPEMGEASDAEPALLKWNQHEEKPKSIAIEKGHKALDKAVVQGLYFTTPSDNIVGVNEYDYDKNKGESWKRGYVEKNVDNIPESILAPALARMRRAFTDNQRSALMPNKKSGKINKRVLGKRAWNNDSRLFAKKILPGKKDYEVIIGVDISYSTIGKNLMLEKRAVLAQAKLLDRAGIPFSIYAHSGDTASSLSWQEMTLEIYHIKSVKEPWSRETERKLLELGPVAANLDGHAMEYLRKRADESRATDKIVLYYSDGKMPAENHDEELEILQREIRYCNAHNITLLGVGIRTDSPRAHGLDTVQVDTDDDLIAVIKHLERRLSVTALAR